MEDYYIRKYKNGKRYLIIILIIIYLPIYSNKKLKELRKLNIITKISIIVNGTGNQSIINGEGFSNHYFNDNPSEIFINDKLQNYNGNVAYNLNDSQNNITMIWDHLLTNCDLMFYSLYNITKIEFINFDTSKVTSMYGMFFNCISITSLNLNNFDTSMVQDMDGMFYGCFSLESLEISNFNTSSVKSMASLFYNCVLLTSIDLSSFDTSSVTEMYSMFYRCQSLKSLNLSNFNTSLVSDMNALFCNCYSLTSLDLTNFNTSLVSAMERMFYNCNSLMSLKINFTCPKLEYLDYMFYNCSSLISLDLNNFNTLSAYVIDIFSNISEHLILCINEDKNPDIISNLSLQNPNYYNNCSDICFNKTIKIKINENNTCSFDCINDEVYKFEYKNMCYESCPNGTHNSINNNFICEENVINDIVQKIEERNKNNNNNKKDLKIYNEKKISIYKRKNEIKKMRLKNRKKEDKEKKDLNLLIKENKINNNMTPKKGISSNSPLSNFSIILGYKNRKGTFQNFQSDDFYEVMIFTFYTSDDYNSKIIKISLFLFSFSIYFTINALFFNDSTMHNIYEAKGSYNFIYQIPIILYSTIISGIIKFN